MKKLLILFFVFQSFLGVSQTMTEVLDKKNFFSLLCENVREVNLTNSDTSYFIGCTFQNYQYLHIVDIGFVNIYNKGDREKIISDLKECLKYMGSGKVNFSIGRFSLIDFSKDLYYFDGSKYNRFNKKQTLKFISWLEGCTLEDRYK